MGTLARPVFSPLPFSLLGCVEAKGGRAGVPILRGVGRKRGYGESPQTRTTVATIFYWATLRSSLQIKCHCPHGRGSFLNSLSVMMAKISSTFPKAAGFTKW